MFLAWAEERLVEVVKAVGVVIGVAVNIAFTSGFEVAEEVHLPAVLDSVTVGVGHELAESEPPVAFGYLVLVIEVTPAGYDTRSACVFCVLDCLVAQANCKCLGAVPEGHAEVVEVAFDGGRAVDCHLEVVDCECLRSADCDCDVSRIRIAADEGLVARDAQCLKRIEVCVILLDLECKHANH